MIIYNFSWLREKIFFIFVKSIDNVTMKDEKYEYVTNAFHELKSPLTTIMLAAEIIKTQNLDDKAKESYLIMILDESLRMKKLITKTINSLKNNYFDVNLNQCCDINEIIENVVKSEGFVEFGLYLMASRHVVRGNVEYIESAFRELIENARKYRSERPLKINITTANDGNRICIRFSDNGIGIADARLKSFFDGDFCSKSNCEVENQSDTGVGLYFLKRNLQRINGTVSVESKEGRGSVFSITLPIIV